MSKRFWKAYIDDVQNSGVDELAQQYLLEVFRYTMREMATTLVRKAWFDLSDFRRASTYDCVEYKLTMEKYPYAGAEQWYATFEAPNKTLKVFGTLEKDG